jgi:hypothetical protein
MRSDDESGIRLGLVLAACGFLAVTACSAGKPNPGAGGAGGQAGEPAAGGGGGAAGTGGGAAGTGGADGGAGAAAPDASGRNDGPVADRSVGDVADASPPSGMGNAAACARLLGGSGPASQWVSVGPDGKLVYKTTPQGDRIMDFSHAGYMGGGVALPDVPVVQTLEPGGGDDVPAIQAAIDAASQKPLVNGFRGAVLLRPGRYKSGGTLNIAASGVVLRGSGSGEGGTAIEIVGAPHRFLNIHGAGSRVEDTASRVSIVDDYIPSGASSFTVANAAGFKVGDSVLVTRPVTAAWIQFVGMDKLVRNGMPQTWLPAGSTQQWERTITKIAGNQITIDIPLSDSFDGQYLKPPGPSLSKYSFPTRISQSGVESLRAEAPVRTAEGSSGLIDIDDAADCWVKDVWANNFTSGVSFKGGAKRCTAVEVQMNHDPVMFTSAAAPADYGFVGEQNLLLRSSSRGVERAFYVTTATMRGPSVVLDFSGAAVSANLQTHMRWATGLLVDRTVLEKGGIQYVNRGTLGSGHGWSMAWGVVWNSVAEGIKMDQPPGTANWAIGCKGAMSGTPLGTFDSHGTPVFPSSLYLAQLCQRLGPQALANIGYK